MRIIYYFGKGGAGKTVVAAATAAQAAKRGKKTLLLSANAAHGLTDVFGVRVGPNAEEIAPSLFARELSVLAEIRAQWPTLQEYVSTFLRGVGSGKAYVQEIVLFPAIEDLLAMTELWRAAKSNDYDVIVVDGPASAGAMNYLIGPEGLKWIFSSVDVWYRKLALLATPVMQTLFPNRNPFDMLPEIAGRVKELQSFRTNPELTSHRLVTLPEPLPMKDGMRLINYFHLYECPVDAVIVNRIRPAADARQGATLERLRADGASGIARLEVVEQASDPLGLPALEAFAGVVFGERDPLAPLSPARKLHALETGSDGNSLLKLHLPNLELETLDLVTRGGELILELGHFKRNIPLPPEVRAKEAVGADYADGVLTITFA